MIDEITELREPNTIKLVDIDEWSNKIHGLHKQWWINLETGILKDRNKGETIALIHSEISEAFDGWQKNIMDDHLPNRKMEDVELADALIRIFDYIGGYGYKLGKFKIGEYNGPIKPLTDSSFCNMHKLVSNVLEAERKSLPIEIELHDLIRYIVLVCERAYIKWEEIIEEKLEYNSKRSDHKLENRRKEGGKKF